jgi:hypothetical protein
MVDEETIYPLPEGHLRLWLRTDAGSWEPMFGWQDQSGNNLHATSVDTSLPSLVQRSVTVQLPNGLGETDATDLKRRTVKISTDRKLVVSNVPEGQKVWMLHVSWQGGRFAVHEQSAVDFATALDTALFKDKPEGGEVAEVLAYDRPDRKDQAATYLRTKYQA